MKKISMDNLRSIARVIKSIEVDLKNGCLDYYEVELIVHYDTNELELKSTSHTDYFNYKHIATLTMYGFDTKEVRTIPQIVTNLRAYLGQ